MLPVFQGKSLEIDINLSSGTFRRDRNMRISLPVYCPACKDLTLEVAVFEKFRLHGFGVVKSCSSAGTICQRMDGTKPITDKNN